MNVFTASEMQECDRRTEDEYHVPTTCLMEAAGVALAQACREELAGTVHGKTILFLCGKGNNGGDGFVAARHLLSQGANVSVVLFGGTEADLSGDALTHFVPLRQALADDQKAILCRVNLADAASVGEDLAALIKEADLVCDCVYGTGFRPPLPPLLQTIAKAVQVSGVRVVSCDIPSGIHADTGEDGAGGAFVAHRTVTLAGLKRGLLFYPGASYAGTVTVAPIGIPSKVLGQAATATLTTIEWVGERLPERTQSRDANKGAFGTVLVVAGSAGMAGAATLTGLSALRAGAGLVYLALPESVLDTAAVLAPELVLHGLPETPERSHGGEGAIELLLRLAEKVDAVAVGPGLGGNNVTKSFVQTFVKQMIAQKPLVIDADGLNAVAESGSALFAHRTGANTILTPHPGEAGRLLGKSAAMIQADRVAAVTETARKYRATVLLKGVRTLITTDENTDHLYINRRGSVTLATAGSGDVLTGVLAALLADRRTPFSAPDAARVGAFLHALAGELCEQKQGTVGTLATEIRDMLPEARRALREPDLIGSLTTNDFFSA